MPKINTEESFSNVPCDVDMGGHTLRHAVQGCRYLLSDYLVV